ncbi:ferredoxin--NADP reductase [Hyphobacterium sp.]|uniref:ferredoxin--NADP reductase n=1 Tax=Hyphobacterium sp. TaxID=2004662 RepID=UPI003BAD2C4B
MFDNILTDDYTPPKTCTVERVTAVKHWTDTLFSFRITRPQAFRFRAGEFIMIGLMIGGKPVLRAYSICSPTWDEELEFYSIKAPGGQLTTELQHIKVGDGVLLGKKPTGTLVHDALVPGKHLYLFSTGTGIAPFASIIREPETYDKFEEVILTHTCRTGEELAYGQQLVEDIRRDPLVGELVGDRLIHFTSTTRDDSQSQRGRITDLIENGELAAVIGRPDLDPATDRVMICGSEAMLRDLKDMMIARGFTEGSNAVPAQFVIEKAFAGDGVTS